MAEIPDVEIITPRGDACRVRIAREPDAVELIEYLNRIGGETPFLPSGVDEFHATAEEESKFIARMREADNSLYLVAELGVSVTKDFWRQGVGRTLLETALGWAENSLVLRKVFLLVHHENRRAIDLYLKLGFVREGVHSGVLCVEGVYHDCLYMARPV
jgi:RimJ/RimL family protein N-acetyltransferase